VYHDFSQITKRTDRILEEDNEGLLTGMSALPLKETESGVV